MILDNNQPVESMLQQLTAEQKRQAFQLLWKEVVEDHQEEIGLPAWHEETLRERLEKISNAKDHWQDLDQTFDNTRESLLEGREKRLASGEAQLMELDDFIAEMRRTMP